MYSVQYNIFVIDYTAVLFVWQYICEKGSVVLFIFRFGISGTFCCSL